jgi:hypothetical protein
LGSFKAFARSVLAKSIRFGSNRSDDKLHHTRHTAAWRVMDFASAQAIIRGSFAANVPLRLFNLSRIFAALQTAAMFRFVDLDQHVWRLPR